jgi:hypothetical protein
LISSIGIYSPFVLLGDRGSVGIPDMPERTSRRSSLSIPSNKKMDGEALGKRSTVCMEENHVTFVALLRVELLA